MTDKKKLAALNWLNSLALPEQDGIAEIYDTIYRALGFPESPDVTTTEEALRMQIRRYEKEIGRLKNPAQPEGVREAIDHFKIGEEISIPPFCSDNYRHIETLIRAAQQNMGDE